MSEQDEAPESVVLYLEPGATKWLPCTTADCRSGVPHARYVREDLLKAKDELIAAHQRSFKGHVYVPNDEYAKLCADSRAKDERIAELERLLKFQFEAVDAAHAAKDALASRLDALRTAAREFHAAYMTDDGPSYEDAIRLQRLCVVEERRPDPVRKLVNEQAEDSGLWFEAQTAAEGYLQQALRRLHAAIEGVSPEECAARAVEGRRPFICPHGRLPHECKHCAERIEPVVENLGPPKPDDEDGRWTCENPKCRHRNWHGIDACWSCGTARVSEGTGP